MRLNGDIMQYKGGDIEWWKLRDLWIESARSGNVDELDSILQEYPKAVDWSGGLFGSALYFAAHAGQLRAVEYLIARGAKLGVEANDGVSPLIAAAGHGHADVVRFLLEKGADVDEKDRRTLCGYTALSWAAYRGHNEAARWLLECGANTQTRNADGKTPRDLAIQQKHPATAALIDTLDTGAFTRGMERKVTASRPLAFQMKMR